MSKRENTPIETGEQYIITPVATNETNNVNDEITNELEEKYPNSSFSYIKLYRINADGEREWLKNYTSIPAETAIRDRFKAGVYQLYVQITDKSNVRHLEKRFITISQASLQDTQNNALERVQEVKSNGFDDMLTQMIKMKQAGLIPENKSNDNTLLTTILANQNAMIMEFIKSNKNGSNGNSDVLLSKLLEHSLQKADKPAFTELNEAFKFAKSLNGDSSGSDSGNTILDIAKAVIPALIAGNRGALPPGQMPMVPATPGRVATGQFDLPGILQRIEQNMNLIATTVNKIDARVKAIEDDFWDEENPNPIIETPVTEINNQQKYTEEEMNYAAIIKTMPEELKVKTLQEFLGKNTPEEIKKWCIDTGAIDTPEEFDRLLKIIQQPETSA